MGFSLAHERLRPEEPLSDEAIIRNLSHAKAHVRNGGAAPAGAEERDGTRRDPEVDLEAQASRA